VCKLVANPAVTVIIPTYNRAEDLGRCLESLVAQTFDNFEVLVCDDGSTDASAEVAEAFTDRLDLRYETAENFGGPARPRNRGIEGARAPYVAFLDSDDWWAPTKLDRSVAVLDAGADLVYHDLFMVRSAGQSRFDERIVSTHPRQPMFVSLLCTGMSIPNSSVVVRRDLLIRIDGISEDRDLISVEDYDTWIRLARLTEKFVRVPECMGYYWFGGGNISAASPRQIFRIKALYAQYLGELPAEHRRRAEGFLAYRIGRIAQMHGDFETATDSLMTALRSSIDFAYRLKAGYWLTRSAVSKIRS
jgi:glycosyltransferase involved in cell wall biosynthesis